MAGKNEATQEENPSLKTILVVEDDADIGEFMVEVIQQETPYQALAATDGFHALKLLNSITPQAFVIDYLMPMMNGLELYERLLHMEEIKHVPVLFTSANPPVKEFQRRHLPYIEKPFEIEHFLEALREVLRKDDAGNRGI